MSTDSNDGWVDLLQTAKTIRRSVRPVSPSLRFRRHLRSDLASALDTPEQARRVIIRQPGNAAPALILGACLGLFVAGLALIVSRSGRPTDHTQ